MSRRETRDRACKKTSKDSGIDSGSEAPRHILPNKVKVNKKSESLSQGEPSYTPTFDVSDCLGALSSSCVPLSTRSDSHKMVEEQDFDNALSVHEDDLSNTNPRLGDDDSHESAGAVRGDNQTLDDMLARRLMSVFDSMARMRPTALSRPASSLASKDAELNRQINAMAPHKEGVDIAKYIKKLEDDFTDIECPRARFKTVLIQKLQSETAADYIASINRSDFTYSELKTALISSLGSSKLSLGIKLTDFASEYRSIDSLKAYAKAKALVDSIDMATDSKADLLLFIASSIFRASRSYHQRSTMDARELKSFKDLSDIAGSLKASESDRTFIRHSSNPNKPTYPCGVCKKYGHRTTDCRYRNVPSYDVPSSNPVPSKPHSIVCFTCNVPGHKSPDCPTKKGGTDNKSDNKPNVKRGTRTYNTNWIAGQNGSPHVEGKVNGMPCRIVPDTGAEITIVPAAFVLEDQLLDDCVNVRGWNCEPKLLPTAKVNLEFGGKSFTSVVAVADENDRCNRVLFSVPMDGDMASRLLLDAASNASSEAEGAGLPGDTPGVQTSAEAGAGSVTIPREACKTSQGSSDNQRSMNVSVVTRSASKRRRVRKHAKHNVDTSTDPFQLECERLADIDLGIVQSAAEVDESVASVAGLDPSGSGLGDGSEASTEVGLNGQIPPTSSVSAVVDQPVKSSGGSSGRDVNISQSIAQECSDNEQRLSDCSDSVSIGIPMCVDDPNAVSLNREVESDDSLTSVRMLASKKLNGYSYNDNGVLIHTVTDDLSNAHARIVLPVSKRQGALVLAHDKTAHVGVRGMRKLLSSRFVWPGVHGDIVKFVKSCDTCLRINASGNKKAMMIQRPILTQPFESVAVDLVGPLPKGKRGSKYVFTYICLSSRWPEAMPMRTASAQEAAQCFVQIIARTGIPLKVLSDRGTIFLSKLMENLCALMGIDTIHTSPYRPQSNGVVERLHGTLKPMLAKAVDNGIDWVDFLPMALFAIRQVPNRDLGFSPHFLVYGREVMGPLDLLYTSFSDSSSPRVDVEDWLVKLQDQLSLAHDLASAREAVARDKRSISYNSGASKRVLKVGDKVLMRIPGLHSSLHASWEGPYSVIDKVSPVTFRVSKGPGHAIKLAHINNLKTYCDRPVNVCAVTLVAEDRGIDPTLLNPSPLLSPDKCNGYNAKQLQSILDVVSDSFSECPGLCTKAVCSITLSEHASPVSQQGRNIPVGMEQAVKTELAKLQDCGIIVKSDALWSSPLVPVKKKDGGVRICVDFRQLNSVTPLIRYWLPSLDEILRKIGQSSCLSTLDLTSGFHQIAMDGNSSDLTTFVCPLGKYKYARMPFGLKNAPAVFQAAVESVLAPVSDVSCNYIDDVVIFSDSWNKHLLDLKRVIDCLSHAGFTLKLKKCCFGRKYLTYLGHTIGGGGLSIPKCRVDSLLAFKHPVTKKDMRSFLGAMSYYRKFIPGFGQHSALLTPSVSLRAPYRVAWTEDMEHAFGELRRLLADSVVLCVPSDHEDLVMYTDASGIGIGACLHFRSSVVS